MKITSEQYIQLVKDHRGVNKGNQSMLCCPIHNDKNPSLSIKHESDGTLLVKCFAGCSPLDILEKFKNDLGITKATIINKTKPIIADQNTDHEKVAIEALTELRTMTESISTGYLCKKLSTQIKVLTSLFGRESYEVFPTKDIEGKIWGYQYINATGEMKKFKAGQKRIGTFFSIGDYEKEDIVYVCEGVATGYSINNLSSKSVVCSLGVSNLDSVVSDFKNKFPNKTLVIAADNDYKDGVEKNPGLDEAKKLSAKHNVPYCFPNTVEAGVSDFNDLEKRHGVTTALESLNNLYAEKPISSQKHDIDKNDSLEIMAAEIFFKDFCFVDGFPSVYLINSDYYVYDNGVYIFCKRDEFRHKLVNYLTSSSEFSQKVRSGFINSVYLIVESKISNLKKNKLSLHENLADENFSDFFVNLQNGILIFNKDFSKLVPHSPTYFSTCKLPYSFDEESTCPIFDGFLNEMIPTEPERTLVWEWFGYNLIPLTKLGKALVLVGEGANGKSVITTVLRELLGPINTSSVGLEAFNPLRTFPLAATIGKAANIVEDLNEVSKVAEGILKSYITGGQITVEKKNRDPIEMIPTARLTFATNILPRITDSTDGAYRRFLVIPMNVQILDDSKQKKELIDRNFWINSNELSGIFNKALVALKELLNRGHFIEPETSKIFLNNYKLENNPAKTFLLEHYSLSNNSESIFSSGMYLKYKEYCLENGYRSLSSQNFSKEVQRTFKVPRSKSQRIDPNTGKRSHFYSGLMWKDPEGLNF